MGNEHSTSAEVKRVVIYTVRIEMANTGAWYAKMIAKQFDCLLEIVDKPLTGGMEIMFKVMKSNNPVRFIKLDHCTIQKQRLMSLRQLK